MGNADDRGGGHGSARAAGERRDGSLRAAGGVRTVALLGGTGRQGGGLARRWAAAGRCDVIIGSRDAGRAERTAGELNARLGGRLVRGMTNAAAAHAADLSVLAVPYAAHAATLTALRRELQDKIVVDVTVRRWRLESSRPAWDTAAGEEAQALLGAGTRVVAAFQTVSARYLWSDTEALDCDVLVSGDDAPAKAEVIALAEAAGMRGVDVGPLRAAAVVEAMTALLIGLDRRYGVKATGIRITGI